MRSLIWEGPRSMSLAEVAMPTTGAGEVLIRVEAVGICGSELSGYLGQNSLRVPPLVMGHEFAGTVTDIGAGTRLLPGTRVVVNPLLSCGRCSTCTAGMSNLCSERRLIGVHLPGAFAEYVVAPEAVCTVVPEAIDMPLAAMAEPVACAVRAVRQAGIGLGSGVAIIGAGPIGLLCALVAKRAGATWSAISDTNPKRLAAARDWGVDYVLDGSRSNLAEAIGAQSAVTAGGVAGVPNPASKAAAAAVTVAAPDAVIDAVGLESTRRQAIAACRRGGSVVFVGLHEPTASFDGNELARNEITVTGSFAYTPNDFAVAVGLLANGLLPDRSSGWMSLRSLSAGPRSFEELVGSEPPVLKIVLQPTSAGVTEPGATDRIDVNALGEQAVQDPAAGALEATDENP